MMNNTTIIKEKYEKYIYVIKYSPNIIKSLEIDREKVTNNRLSTFIVKENFYELNK
jgi:hypothetical protein